MPLFQWDFKLNPLPLKYTLYAAASGAFGVFLRWLQLQIAFDPDGLVDPSTLNVLLPVFSAAVYCLFRRFNRQLRTEYTLPKSYAEILCAPSAVFRTLRIVIAAMMALGGLMLLVQCNADRDKTILQLLAAGGILSGAAFYCAASGFDWEEKYRSLLCLCAAAPIVLFSGWMLVCYKRNDINPVVWSYAPEIIMCAFVMNGSFRTAGFAFHTPAPWKTLFFCMFCPYMLLTLLGDERYFGMQLMILSQALAFLYYLWVMLENAEKKETKTVRVTQDDGFEHL